MNGPPPTRQRGFSAAVQSPWIVVLVASLAGGGTAIGYRHTAFSDPYPGRRGELVEEQLREIVKAVEHIETEHDFFRERLANLPPRDLLEDVSEVREDVGKLRDSLSAVRIQLVELKAMLRDVRTSGRGHWSPNDIIPPGMFREGSSNEFENSR